MHDPALPTASPPARHVPRWLKALLWLGAGAVLAAVFGLYLDPDFMLLMADQVWACF